MSSGANGLWAWVATASRPSARPVLDALSQAVERHAAVRVTAGRAIPWPEGFRRSHNEAVAAQRVAAASRGRRTFTHYEDVELIALLSLDETATGAFIDNGLGALADGQHERLRRTALAVLKASGNHTAAAHTLGVHRNTVRNHVNRVERLLGRPLLPPRIETQLALILTVERV